jgi:hypothetical protein
MDDNRAAQGSFIRARRTLSTPAVFDLIVKSLTGMMKNFCNMRDSGSMGGWRRSVAKPDFRRELA